MFTVTQVGIGGAEVDSGCLQCPDVPCIQFTSSEILAELPVPTPVAPDPAVCPADALHVGPDEIPLVNTDRCVGCGLCAVRCPVGAIHIDEQTAIAVITPPGAAYVRKPYDPEGFRDERAAISRTLVEEQPPYDDAGNAVLQLERIEGAALFRADAQRLFRLLARNAFLIIGRAARLKNAGDNNAFAELAVGLDDGRLVVVEIEPAGDQLDALRRVLTGMAVVRSRYHVEATYVIPCVIVRRLPNERVDYYRVLSDVAARLGVAVRTLPVGLILLAIRSHDRTLLDAISTGTILGEDNVDLGPEAEQLWGPIGDPRRLGVTPEK